MPAVWCVVLAYNAVDLTLACIESLRRQDYPHLDILVVDNASSDGTAGILAERFPDVGVLALSENLGYAGGNNLGMRHALQQGADLLFLVNNDTRFESNCVSKLVAEMIVAPHCGVVGPMVYTWDGWSTISSAGGEVDWRHADAINVGAGEVDTGQYGARSVDFINGCAIMVSREAVERVGLIDERFFMYWEETDWCRRIAAAGFDVRFQPAARMQHKAPLAWEGQSALALYYAGRNRMLFFARHAKGTGKAVALARVAKGLVSGTIRNRRTGNQAAARAARAALTDALMARWGKQAPTLT